MNLLISSVQLMLVLKSAADAQSSFALFPSVDFVQNNASDGNCDTHSRTYDTALQNFTNWAVRMWDSSVKQPVGWIAGTTAQFGNFDECLSSPAPYPVQYCLSQLLLTLPQTSYPRGSVWDRIQNPPVDQASFPRSIVWLATCLPVSCVPALRNSSTPAGSHDGNVSNYQWQLNVIPPFCTPANQPTHITPGVVLFLLISFVLFAAVIFATIIDFCAKRHREWTVVQCLSLRTSFPRLIAPSTEHNPTLAIGHGLKVGSIILVVYAHRAAIPYTFTGYHHEDYEANTRDPLFKFLAQSDLTVDTFLFLAGIIMSYDSLKRNVRPLFYVIGRLCRLWPLYLWIVWMEASLMPYLGTGPLWNAVQLSESQHCADNWWLNALFLQNYIKSDQMCLVHTWFAPTELHCYLVAVVLLWLTQWRRKVGVAVSVLLTVLACVVPGIVTYLSDYDPLILFYMPAFILNPLGNRTFLEFYTKTHNRMGPYFIGFLCGFYLNYFDETAQKPDRKKSLISLVTSVVLLLAPMVYGLRFYDPSQRRMQLEEAVFVALRRTLWALGLSFFMIANRMYKIPIISTVFTWRPVAIVSRLSYGIYLIHFPYIVANMAKTRVPPPFKWFDILFSGEPIASLLFAAILFLLIEHPLKQLLGSMVAGRKPARPADEDSDQIADATRF